VSYDPRDPADAHDISVSPSTWDLERGTALFVIALSGLAALGFSALAAHLLRRQRARRKPPRIVTQSR
jgi:hypothetical protein